jgi:hypothetical protein
LHSYLGGHSGCNFRPYSPFCPLNWLLTRWNLRDCGLKYAVDPDRVEGGITIDSLHRSCIIELGMWERFAESPAGKVGTSGFIRIPIPIRGIRVCDRGFIPSRTASSSHFPGMGSLGIPGHFRIGDCFYFFCQSLETAPNKNRSNLFLRKSDHRSIIGLDDPRGANYRVDIGRRCSCIIGRRRCFSFAWGYQSLKEKLKW